MSADVVVVGAGAIGCSVAYECARAGLAVEVVEAVAVGAGASGLNPGVVSLATKSPGLRAALAVATLRRFAELTEELAADFELSNGGSLLVFEDEREQSFVQARLPELARDGAELRIIDVETARSLQPLLHGPIRGAAWSPADAVVNPRLLLAAWERAARKLGVRFRTGHPVTGVRVRSGSVAAVVTDAGAIPARWVVNAAGVNCADIGAMVGVPHAVEPRKGQLMSTGRIDGVAPVRVTSAAELLAKETGGQRHIGLGMTPKPDGTIVLGGSYEAGLADASPDPAIMAMIGVKAGRMFPRLAQASIERVWCGFRPHSTQGPPLTGTAGGPDGYLVAGGFGGDGLSLSPVVGRYLADLITGTADQPIGEWLAKPDRTRP